MRQPSYNDGYHSPQSGFRGKNPNLWDGCVIAMDPGLGNTGAVLFDHSGYANHGTIVGDLSLKWVTNDCGVCLDFPDTGDYINIPYSETFASQCYSWSIWVKSTEAGGNLGLISRWQNSGGTYSWVVTWEGAGGIYWYQAGLSQVSGTTVVVNDGKWHHLCGTYDKTAAKLYCDGIEKHSVANTGNYTATTQPLVLGTYATSQDWDGQLRAFAFWNRGLSPGEVRELASDPAAMYHVRQRFTFYQPPVDTSMFGRSFSGEFASSQIAGNVTAIGASVSGETSKAIASGDVLLIGSGTSGAASTATTIGNGVCLASSLAGEVSVGYSVASGVAFAAGVSGESSVSRMIADGVALGRGVSGEASTARTIADGIAFSAGRSSETSKAWVISDVAMLAGGISGETSNASLLADSAIYAASFSGEHSTARVVADSLVAGASTAGSVGLSVVGGDTVIVGCSISGIVGSANSIGTSYGFGAGISSLFSSAFIIGRVPTRARCVTLSASANYSTTVVAYSRNATVTAAATYSAVGEIDKC